jgi:hypothetical protein
MASDSKINGFSLMKLEGARMNKPLGLFGLMLIILALACNIPAATPTVTATTVTAGSVTPLATPSPLASATSEPTAIPTPTIPIVAPKDLPVNCRVGPGLFWEAVSGLLLGKTAEIAGKNSSFEWWYIKDPINHGQFCWVAMSATIASGNLSGISEIPVPTAQVTTVSVKAEVSFVACGGPNPVDFSGTVKTNGPATIVYQWEVTGDSTNTTSPETLEVDEFGVHEVPNPGAYKVDCGDYTIRLHVTSPNDKSGKDDFSVQP